MVAENTFRPPWYHMNVMSEFMGLVYGVSTTPSRRASCRAASRLHNTHAAARPGRRRLRGGEQRRARHRTSSRARWPSCSRRASRSGSRRLPRRAGALAGRLRRLRPAAAEALRSERSREHDAASTHTHDPARRSWVASANGHADFPIQNLPLGRVRAGRRRAAARRRRHRRRDPRPGGGQPRRSVRRARPRAPPRPPAGATLNALLGARRRAARGAAGASCRRCSPTARAERARRRAAAAPGRRPARCTCRRRSATTPTSTPASITR